MKNKHYLGEVMERFMTDKEQEKFDQNYNDVKMVTLGRSGLVKKNISKNEYKNQLEKKFESDIQELYVSYDKLMNKLNHRDKTDNWNMCACGGVRLPHSDFCRDCI